MLPQLITMTSGSTAIKTSTMTYYLQVVSNAFDWVIDLPGLSGIPLTTRNSAIRDIKSTEWRFGHLVADAKKASDYRCGLGFKYKGESYPIFGFGGHIPFSKLLANMVIEYDIYKANGWLNGFVETEQVYSVEAKDYVTILKHTPELSMQIS